MLLWLRRTPRPFADALARQQDGRPACPADPWDLLAQTYGSAPATPPSKRPGPYASTPLDRLPVAARGSGAMPSVVPASALAASAMPLQSVPASQQSYAAGMSPPAASDSYLASPGQSVLPKAVPPTALSVAGLPAAQLPQALRPSQPASRLPDRTTFGKAGGRVAVKEATMGRARERSTSHPRPGSVNGPASLAEHVELKRAQSAEQQASVAASPAGVQQFLIDDDDEILVPATRANEMD